MAKEKDYDKAIEELSIASNALFSTAFDNRPDRALFLVKDVLNYLGYRDFEIVSSKTQASKSHLLQHDTITDVEIRLASGHQILVEIQLTHPERFTAERARFLLASNDVAFLDKGKDYLDLPDQILLVISKKDLLGTGLPIVTVRRIIQENGEVFPDKQILVYVAYENIKDDGSPISQFLMDCFETDLEKIKDPIAREIHLYFKRNEGKMYLEGYFKEIVEKERAEVAAKVAQEKDAVIERKDTVIREQDAEIQKLKKMLEEQRSPQKS